MVLQGTFLVHTGALLGISYRRVLNKCVQNVHFGCIQTHSKYEYVNLGACKRYVHFCIRIGRLITFGTGFWCHFIQEPKTLKVEKVFLRRAAEKSITWRWNIEKINDNTVKG